MGKKGHVRARTAKAKKLNSNKKRMLYGAPVARKPTSLVVATAGAGGTTAHAEAEASSAFALHSVLLGSNPNAARVGGYTNTQDILLVGEGDFSYALAIAVALGGKRLTATCYDAKRELFSKYDQALDNVTTLRSLGATVLYRVDATALHTCPQLAEEAAKLKRRRRRFHRVIFNFPHAGGGSTRADVEQNQDMLRAFFTSASKVIRRSGSEIHVALRSTPFYESWHIEDLAKDAGLVFKHANRFDASEFTGYKPQRTHPAMRESPSTANAKTYVFTLPKTAAARAASARSAKAQVATRDAKPSGTGNGAGRGATQLTGHKRARASGATEGTDDGADDAALEALLARRAARRPRLADKEDALHVGKPSDGSDDGLSATEKQHKKDKKKKKHKKPKRSVLW